MILSTLFRIFADHNCQKLYIKSLAANDNSKNQVYFGGNFEVLNILPINDIIADDGSQGGSRMTRFKSKIDFSWITDDGRISPAPNANLILYPDYPEVRFSGFLSGSKDAPSSLMNERARIPERLLFLGVTQERKILGFVTAPESELANEFNNLTNLDEFGVFKSITLNKAGTEVDGRKQLLHELRRIYELGWIDSKRLDSKKEILPCTAPQCGGYTLEAELGISPNGFAEPDFMGWEIKQYAVKRFDKLGSSIITLMTPEPTHGFYVSSGVEEFILKYGYDDKLGRESRKNFGGIFKYNTIQKSTQLKLTLIGYNGISQKIEDVNGCIALICNRQHLI